MKTRIASVLILAAALSTSAFVPLSAASKDNRPVAYAVGTVYLDASRGLDEIAHGTSKAAVLQLIGSPRQALTSDVWVYRGFRANLDAADTRDCSTLVITFTRGEVASLKLMNQAAVGIIAMQSNPKAAERYASAR